MTPTGKSPVNIVLGLSSVGDTSADYTAHFDTPDEVNGILNIFAARGYNQIDTARLYSPLARGTSEPRIGAVAAGERFVIDTKVMSGTPGDHEKSKVLEEIDISLEALKVSQINIEYLHLPDRTTKFEEACEAMDQAYRGGKIKSWGLSNYTASEVQQFLDICEERGLVKPSVYQGHYNAIVRAAERELFSILRKNDMAFYAFSPAAGGFFAGNAKKVKTGGRYDTSHFLGGLYTSLYMKPSIVAAVDNAVAVAAKYGVSGHAAALRWTASHSALDKTYGDSIIVGASSSDQLISNMDAIEQGPLPGDVVAAFESVYGEIDEESEVPYHHSNSRRQVHSHAARISHARARRLRMLEYTQQNSGARDGSSSEESNHQPADRTQQYLQALVSQHVSATPIPMTISGAFEHEPLATFLRSLAPREHFLFSHYVKVVLPYMCARCPIMRHIAEYHDYMKSNWILFSSVDVDLLKGFLLASCRHLSLIQMDGDYNEIATRYKLSYIQNLRRIIASEDPSLHRLAVSRALVLAFDDVRPTFLLTYFFSNFYSKTSSTNGTL
ncbi:NADP-dependent oxidoreductase domain-containing protein [Hypoxylon sp. FL1284]|nr:NADP-dependent oxidoreductase domain-containing protein [Hypoxylon sp. FL1284]